MDALRDIALKNSELFTMIMKVKVELMEQSVPEEGRLQEHGKMSQDEESELQRVVSDFTDEETDYYSICEEEEEEEGEEEMEEKAMENAEVKADKSSRWAEKVAEQVEAELKRLKMESEQCQKAAEAAAAIVVPTGTGRSTGSLFIPISISPNRELPSV